MSDEKELHTAIVQQAEEVENNLRSQKYTTALKIFLDSPPYGTKIADTKKIASDSVLRVIGMIKDADIDNYVEDLSSDQADALLKYVYKGFESGDNSAQLLKWHASIVNKHGMGAIVRAMQVKRTV
eukprot:TRINITY_DN7365_c0_g1_i1.p1 TRINITY_DN7365_c0_g1~~TRINITY_DN7365_c0_g1_i1.p1  ORF type:complete len:145 (-),score=41.98 TRINITY_DN7365_c0_g1_i1:95-472(-)